MSFNLDILPKIELALGIIKALRVLQLQLNDFVHTYCHCGLKLANLSQKSVICALILILPQLRLILQITNILLLYKLACTASPSPARVYSPL